MNDWTEGAEKRKEEKNAKKQGIESSGALLRRLAMGELEDDDDFESGEDERDEYVEEAISSPQATISASVASTDTETPQTRTTTANQATPVSLATTATPSTTSSSKKRSTARSHSSGRKKKITKREQLGSVTEALKGAIWGRVMKKKPSANTRPND
ncbi:hypothetical protein V7S43_010271 [Phytophthora oleae]|uniref:Uncharacterized protein n=1 Tax=Phytophthora oleae TaxID=2107226 RepID=A0ABD3FHP7_9STRA